MDLPTRGSDHQGFRRRPLLRLCAAIDGSVNARRRRGLNGESILLTRRQLDVLRRLADGKSTDEIAAELAVSRATARNHIANLLAALGAHSRLQAVAIARRAGILSGDV